jgi:hypothetical protein
VEKGIYSLEKHKYYAAKRNNGLVFMDDKAVLIKYKLASMRCSPASRCNKTESANYSPVLKRYWLASVNYSLVSHRYSLASVNYSLVSHRYSLASVIYSPALHHYCLASINCRRVIQK